MVYCKKKFFYSDKKNQGPEIQMEKNSGCSNSNGVIQIKKCFAKTNMQLDPSGRSEMVRLHSGLIALPILGIPDVAIRMFSAQMFSFLKMFLK